MNLNNVDCMLLWKTWNKNPNHLVFTKLQNNSKQSYFFAKDLITNNKEVPKIIKKSAREYKDDFLCFNESFKQCYNKL